MSNKLDPNKETTKELKLKTAERELIKTKEKGPENETKGVDQVMDEEIPVKEFSASTEVTPPVNETKIEDAKVKADIAKDELSGLRKEEQKLDDKTVAEEEENLDDYNAGYVEDGQAVSSSKNEKKKLARAEQKQQNYPVTTNTVFFQNFKNDIIKFGLTFHFLLNVIH